MKVFFDTSVLVAASEQGHPHYGQALPALRRVTGRKDQGFMSVHSIAEMYAALTRLPVQPRIHPAEAARIITDNILPHFEAVPIGKKDYVEALKLVGNGGGAERRFTTRCSWAAPRDAMLTGFTLSTSRIFSCWLLPSYRKRYARREIRTAGSGRSGLPSETFCEDTLRLAVILAKRMSVRETNAFALLKKHLFALVPGEIAETGRVTALLAGCWHEFVGAESQRMHAGKLGRIENVLWEPPVLCFRIERHGAMGVGSTRAELQHWRVDLDRKTAQCERSGSYRQALPRAEGVRIEPRQGNLPIA